MANLHGMVVDTNNPLYDFVWLCRMMQDRKRVRLVAPGHKGYENFEGVINGIRPEDGGGKNWLVTICGDRVSKEIFIKAA